MGLWELFVIALGLSMDAFAVSICKGLSVRRCTPRHMLICGLYFGVFQALMPLIGYFLGSQFESLVTAIAPYIAFALLAFIGANMIREGIRSMRCDPASAEEVPDKGRLTVATILVQAVATAIDAFAVGVGLRAQQTSLSLAAATIGVTTFLCCVVGLLVGRKAGERLGDAAECVGGVVLVLIGLRQLL